MWYHMIHKYNKKWQKFDSLLRWPQFKPAATTPVHSVHWMSGSVVYWLYGTDFLKTGDWPQQSTFRCSISGFSCVALIFCCWPEQTVKQTCGTFMWRHCNHGGWTPLRFYCMYDPKCSTTFPWCTINVPAAFAWCTINAPAVFAWCTNQFVHKVEFSYIEWNGVHTLWLPGKCCKII